MKCNFFGVGCDGHDIIRKKVSVQFLNRFQISWIRFKGETKETFGVGCLLSPCEGLRFISRVLGQVGYPSNWMVDTKPGLSS